MSDAAPKHASRKRLLAGCHVSGSFGELIPNPDPNKKQCVHKRLVGNVLHAVGHSKYMVAFDNGETFECCSNRLRVEARTSAIPPDVPPEQAVERPANAPPQPLAAVEQEIAELIEATEDSHEDEEHIPPPQDEDEDEDNAGDETAEDVEDVQPGGEQPINDPEGRMPGQLAPAATVQQEIRTYAQ